VPQHEKVLIRGTSQVGAAATRAGWSWKRIDGKAEAGSEEKKENQTRGLTTPLDRSRATWNKIQ